MTLEARGRAACACAAAALVMAIPGRARADLPVRTDVALVSGSLGLALSVGSIIYGTKVAIDLLRIRNGERNPFDGPSVRYNAQVGTFTTGAILLALGGVAIGMQASVGGPCPGASACQVAYGFGGASLTVGVGMLVEGIVITTAPQTVRLRLPFLSYAPRPIVLSSPLSRSPVWGIGLAGSLGDAM